MYYFNYKDELYHYGRKGMKWGENIFTKGLDSLNNKIREADAKATGTTKSSLGIPTYSEFKSKYGSGGSGGASKTTSSKGSGGKTINMEQRLIDARARVLGSAGNAKTSGKGGSGKKGGGGGKKAAASKASTKKESTKKESTKKEKKEDTKVQQILEETTSKEDTVRDYSELSVDEIVTLVKNGEFDTLDSMREKLGEELYKKVYDKLLAEANGQTSESDSETTTKTKAEQEKINNGEAVVKKMYDTIFPNEKKKGSK